MGSFYAKCSITQKTIVDGQQMVIQFMLPNRMRTKEDSSGRMFVDIFLKAVKKEGVDKALKTWEEATKNWGDELPDKGMIVSNNIATTEFVPFGPAIRGTYDDCGDIVVDMDDPENAKRVKLLEAMCGVPFKSIMGAATDDRWYKYGYLEKSKSGHDWSLEGIHEELPEGFIRLLKLLTVTYFHAAAYDKMVDPEFDVENGKPDKYSREWKGEYNQELRDNFPKLMDFYTKSFSEDKPTEKAGNKAWREIDHYSVGHIKDMNDLFAMLMWSGMKKTGSLDNFDWYYETCNLLSTFAGLCQPLTRSYYGSQHRNWRGLNAIHAAVDEVTAAALKEWEGEEEEA